jgi:hypothetical protein
MKQAEDLCTTSKPWAKYWSTQGATTPSKFRFRFYVTTRDGATTEWTGLTAKRAKDMYAYTAQSQPSNVTAFGWEEMK